MKLYQYLFLDEQMQYQTVWDIGIYLKKVKQGGVLYMLYAINDFYVEIMYRPGTNKIIGKNEFKQGERLDKYLPKLVIKN